MEKQIAILLEKMKEQLKEQSKEITANLTATLSAKIDEKIEPLLEGNKKLKQEVEKLNTKIYNMEKEARKNNVIVHGVLETENNNMELLNLVLDTLNIMSTKSNIEKWDKWEISRVTRIGKKNERNSRPILITVTLHWRKIEILRSNKSLPGSAYATDDFPKEVLIKRKELKSEMEEQRKKGTNVVIRYDKLIVLGSLKEHVNKEKRRRSPTHSPQNNTSLTLSPSTTNYDNKQHRAPKKINKIDAFPLSRARSSSLNGNDKEKY